LGDELPFVARRVDHPREDVTLSGLDAVERLQRDLDPLVGDRWRVCNGYARSAARAIAFEEREDPQGGLARFHTQQRVLLAGDGNREAAEHFRMLLDVTFAAGLCLAR